MPYTTTKDIDTALKMAKDLYNQALDSARKEGIIIENNGMIEWNPEYLDRLGMELRGIENPYTMELFITEFEHDLEIIENNREKIVLCYLLSASALLSLLQIGKETLTKDGYPQSEVHMEKIKIISKITTEYMGIAKMQGLIKNLDNGRGR